MCRAWSWFLKRRPGQTPRGFLVFHLLAASVWAEPQAGDPLTAYLPGGTLMEFRWIPPGIDTLGTTAAQAETLRRIGLWDPSRADEQPAYTFRAAGFYLGAYEVTQYQWLSVMRTAPWLHSAPYQPSAPAICISWDMAHQFVGRLNAAIGDSLYRLPTEAEWEYACRAGTETAWHFGDEPQRLTEFGWVYANAWGRGQKQAQTVGQLRPNPWGLFDMYGNVREWCLDRPLFYLPDGFIGPPAIRRGDYRVTRGGSRNDTGRAARSAARDVAVPSTAYNVLLGFRIVRRR